MYPSDYGYATSGGNSMNRSTCLSFAILNWQNANTGYCRENNWLYNDTTYQWTLTPTSFESQAFRVFATNTSGHVHNGRASTQNAVLPVVYLNYLTKITDGIGTKEEPFKLSL